MSKKATVRKGDSPAWMRKVGDVTEALLKCEGRPVKSGADNVIKFHFDELDEGDIQTLADLLKSHPLELRVKRSGTGLTVLVYL